MNISNIEFVQTTYQNLSLHSQNEKFDLIVAVNALELEIPPPSKSFLITSYKDSGSNLSPAKIEPIKDFVIACKNLVQENGVIYINPGCANEFGLCVLFENLRDNGLGVDWFHTTASIKDNCEKGSNCSGINEMHLFIRPSFPTTLESAWDDVRAIMLAAQWSHQTVTLKNTDFETYLELLSSGERILEITAEVSGYSKEKFLIYAKAGMVGFFRISEECVRSGMIHSAAAMFEIVGRLKKISNKTK